MGNPIEDRKVIDEFANIMAGEVSNWLLVFETEGNKTDSVTIRRGGSGVAAIGLLAVASEYLTISTGDEDGDED